NTLIAELTRGQELGIGWTREGLWVAGRKYPAADHVPVLIQPNPLNPTRYVVLNSGHTFHAEDFQGTNALLYPRLGDWAVLHLADKGPALAVQRVVENGLRTEGWAIPAGK